MSQIDSNIDSNKDSFLSSSICQNSNVVVGESIQEVNSNWDE